MTNAAVILFLVIAAAAVVLIVIAAVLLVIVQKRKMSEQKMQNTQTPEPLPGGGGSYVMHISGMNCEHCRANAEAALNAFEGVQAKVDLKSETAQIRYSGYPDLDLLDRLQKAVEEAGFTVTKIQ